MADLLIERLGGVAGMGGPGSAIRSRGRIADSDLGAEDRESLAALFDQGVPAGADLARDSFRYRITRTGEKGSETIEVPENLVPAAIAQSVRDEFI